MNRTTLAATGAIAAAALAASAQAGVVEYTIHGDQPTATLGDTVTITVDAAIDAQGSPFHAIALAAFNILSDDIPAGGTVDFSSPGLGLAPEFVALGSNGTLVGNDIMGIQAAQLPGSLNPGANTDTNLTVYTFQYTVDDDTPRDITFDLSGMTSQVYGSSAPGASAIYTSTSNSFTLGVTNVPAPGAAALLGAAGLICRRRRRLA